MALFTSIRNELERYLTHDQIDLVYQAYRFAEQLHKGQQRRTGDPYITHPIAVALILAQMRMDMQTIIAAILHDTIEDTVIEKKNITEKFGAEVAELVDGVSKLTQVQFQTRAEAQAENFRKMLLAMAKDIRVILIKLIDRLHNMRTLGAMAPEKRARIAKETLDIYAPIAERLGMHAICIELEDLSFYNLKPFRYRVLQEATRKIKRKSKKSLAHIETAFKKCLEQKNLPPSAIWHKQKNLYSIYKEMSSQQLSFSEVMKVPIFCIIVDNLDTCYRVLGAVHNLYKPLIEQFHDYIALPKTNGYQALHTTLFGPFGTPLAVQIRTAEMDNRADSGIATYLLENTSKTVFEQTPKRVRKWLQRLLEIQKVTPSPLEFIESIKTDLNPSDIYIFTPKGDIIELPKGATPIDLAYAIHSDIGEHCVAAQADKRLIPLSAKLVTGQTVEIMTDSSSVLNPTWLNFVVTSKARGHIRHALKLQQHNEAIKLGQRLLDSVLFGLSTEWSQLSAKTISSMLHKLRYKTEEEMLEAIGLGNLTATSVAQGLVKLTTLFSRKKLASGAAAPLLIKHVSHLLIKFSEDCRPIPGDAVVGVLNAGRGIMVHLARCKYAATMLEKQPEQTVPVNWDKQIEDYFKVDICLETSNQRGVLVQVANNIAKTDANIDSVKVEDHDEHRIVYLTLSVRDRRHLAQTIRNLHAIRAVTRIVRGKNLSL